MCLVVLAVDAHPEVPLLVLANRDERHDRPAAAAHAWSDHPGVFAGRDREKGGTWLGVTTGGRFAAVTNVRRPDARRIGRSRGVLVVSALTRDGAPGAWAASIPRDVYPAFNLVVASVSATGAVDLVVATDDDAIATPLGAGIHGLSNGRVGDPWPKVVRAVGGVAALLGAAALDVEAAFAILGDRTLAPDPDLPRTGVPLETERALSPAFIAVPGYGTRASSVVAFHRDGSIRFLERTFGEGGAPGPATDVTLRRAP